MVYTGHPLKNSCAAGNKNGLMEKVLLMYVSTKPERIVKTEHFSYAATVT